MIFGTVVSINVAFDSTFIAYKVKIKSTTLMAFIEGFLKLSITNIKNLPHLQILYKLAYI